MRRPGGLLLSRGPGYSRLSVRLGDHCFGTLYGSTEFIAPPCINRMAIVERPIVDSPRA